MSHPLVGHEAPDFTLLNQHGTPISLADFRRSPVLVVFFPFAFSPLCSQELASLRDADGLKAIKHLKVLAVSCDSMFVQKAWAEQNSYVGDLLSDFWPHGEASRLYGVFNPRRGLATRGTFLIAGDGTVRWAAVNGPDEERHVDEYVEAILGL